MPTISGTLINNGIPANGIVVSLYKASRLSGVPVSTTPPPAGAADATSQATGTQLGPGAWEATVPTIEDYYAYATVGGFGTWMPYLLASGASMLNPMTTAQDMIVGGTSGAPARLGVGAEGAQLGVKNGLVSWLLTQAAAGYSVRDGGSSYLLGVTNTTGLPSDFTTAGQTITIEIWMKTTASAGCLFWCPATASNSGAFLGYAASGGTIQQGWAAGGTNVSPAHAGLPGYQTGLILNDNQWHHIVWVLVHTNSTLLYVDGTLALTFGVSSPGAMGWTDSGATPEIGSGHSVTASFPNDPANTYPAYVGQMDELALYNGALSASQISTHYAAKAQGYNYYGQTVLNDGPLRYYRLDELSGTVAADAANNYPGTYGSGDTLGQPSLFAGVYGPVIQNPMTVQDDMIVGGPGGVAQRLAKGSDSQVLTVNASTHHVAWQTPGPNKSYATRSYARSAFI